MFKCVIFDFDMTLVDSSYAIRDTMNMLAEKQGLPPVTRDQVLEVIGMPIKESWLKVWSRFEEEWLENYRESFLENEFEGMAPFPGTEKVLNFLKERNVALGVASNRYSPVRPMKATGLYDYFGSAVGMGDVENAKPAPDMIIKSMADLGFGPGDSAYVGDTADDMAAARAAGVRGIGVTTSNASKEKLLSAGAWKVADAIEELLPLWKDQG
ncbi:MAG: HAD family hydrolase [Synergistaceae bacterium]|nr:HAD family hydrolase [Synergistaceae bacterium]